MDEQQLAAQFWDQVDHDFPELTPTDGITLQWTQLPPKLTWSGRLRLRWLWWRQGRPRRRGVIVRVGTVVPAGRGDWQLDGWEFDGRFCWPGVVAIQTEPVPGGFVLRAVCGWHIPDLQAAAGRTAGQLRHRRIW